MTNYRDLLNTVKFRQNRPSALSKDAPAARALTMSAVYSDSMLFHQLRVTAPFAAALLLGRTTQSFCEEWENYSTILVPKKSWTGPQRNLLPNANG